MSNIKVSVIVPVYNAEKYIDKCLEKLLNQDFNEEYEIIMINDGSKDNSLKILKTYEKSNKKIIKVISQENKGQAVARNKALDIAKGEYVMFVDVDDFVSKSILSKMYFSAKKNKSDLVYCDYYEYYSNDKLIYKQNYFSNSKNQNAILANFAPWGKLYNLNFFKNSGFKFLEGKLFEDIAIVPVLASLSKNPIRIDEALYYYNCSNVSSIRKSSYSKRLEDVFYSIDETYNNFKKTNLFDKYYDEVEFIYLDSFLKGAVFRFADFKEGLKKIPKVRRKIKAMFPNMLKNKYYKESKLSYKFYVIISYYFPSYLIYLIKKVKK